MSIDPLEQAIVLIEQNNLPEAQKILEQLLSVDRHNLPAWYNYARTFPAGEKRIKALELCLKYNPDNMDVKQTLKSLRSVSYQQSQEDLVTEVTGKQILLTILYFIVTAAFVIQLVYAINMLNALGDAGAGFGGLPFLFFWFVVLSPQWILVFVVPPLYIILKRKQKSATRWILGTGLLTGTIFAIYSLLSELIGTPREASGASIAASLSSLPFSFVFDFISGAGLGTFLLLIFDTIKWVTNGVKDPV
jgi:hypothetical protein